MRVAGLAALIALGVVITVASLLFVDVSHRTSLRTVEFFSPALRAISAVSGEAESALRRAVSAFDSEATAERVRLEEETAQYWRNRAQALEIENAQLRRQLGVLPEVERPYLTARVIGGPSGPFGHSILIDAGAVHGVSEGATVTMGDSLVGRVIGVGERASRILLLSDPNSRVPVRVGPLGSRAILTGDGTGRPILEFPVHDQPLAEGTRVVTSGTGGVFLRNVLVGRVESADGRVRLDAGRGDRLEFLRVSLPSPPGPIPAPTVLAPGERASSEPFGPSLGAEFSAGTAVRNLR